MTTLLQKAFAEVQKLPSYLQDELAQLKVFGFLLFASVFASFSTILYGVTVAGQAVSLLEVLLIAGLLSAIVTAPLAGLGLWSRRKQDIEDSSFARLLVKDELILSLFLAIALGILCGTFLDVGY